MRGTTFMPRISKFNDLEARKSDAISPHTVDSTKSTIPKFSNQFKASTNERRSLQISQLEYEGSNQRTNQRQAFGVKQRWIISDNDQ